ncbi:hypothetical protein JAAARDRAFT_73906 [Jaapia argillacea MUCL 33604]|uniref:RRM domain-containing protein n=1 Tax=Jaapia argillacea MUCL 33604 TaxID=933084 RepID=A0A067P877_9AGAM|nr:hypothetical protein JAAARDRAFT_73906 [Jaapia argillacea MUCL 33604]
MSKVVFVGNVPYTMGEEQLIEVFKSVGQVVGFRLVFDRDTGKPRGYGFCEFADHDTAMSAVRNLNNVDVGGRPLRIDLADSDPFLEGKTTVRGEIIDGGGGGGGGGESRSQWRDRDRDRDRDGGRGTSRNRDQTQDPNIFLSTLPPGVPVPHGKTPPDVITQVLAETPPSQITEVLAQMKAFVITHPDQARTLLMAHPQLGYALFQAMIMNKILDEAIVTRMQAAASSSRPPPPQVPMPPPHLAPPPHMYAQPPPMHQPQPMMPPPMMHPGQPPMQAMPPGPPPPGMYTHHQHVPPPPPPQYYQPPPQQQQQPPQGPGQGQQQAQAAAAQVQQDGSIDPAQKAMLLQVLQMTPEQINALEPSARATVNQIRDQIINRQPQPTY